MRFLLISDTHGKLAIINELAAHVHADAVIHAGDFGFYDDGSYDRLSDRELRLQIIHSDLAPTEKERVLALPHDQRIEAARRNCPLSELPLYIDRERRFDVPVYAVWGNHEDKEVVERAFRGEIPEETVHIGRGRKAPRWYARMTHVNLPDARVGYAVVDVEGTHTAIHTMVR
jgi:predicted phosphodiesterase